MSEKKKNKAPGGAPPEEVREEVTAPQAETPEVRESAGTPGTPEAAGTPEGPETSEVLETDETPETPEAPEEDPLQAQLAAWEEKYLRLCAEYDNYRKRTAKEKEAAWSAAKGETAKAFLPVYDNLERALKQETADEAYRKGVEMTMAQLKKVLGELGLEEIPALGESFDAKVHSAVMHVEDPELGENTVKEVIQAGFKLGDTIIRYAMVVVAN